MVEFGNKIGDLNLYHYSEAIARGFGALEDPIKNEWYLPVDFMVTKNNIHTPITKALVVWKRSEPTNIDMALPEIVINRDNMVPAPRLQSQTILYKFPAPGATPVSVNGQIGWTYVTKEKLNHGIYFILLKYGLDTDMWQRFATDDIGKIPQHGKVIVVDSIGNENTYATFQTSVTDLTQVTNMVDRVVGFAIALRVEGELTLGNQEFVVNSFTGTTTTGPVPGVNDNDPNPGPGGLYGDGRVITRVTLSEDI